MKVIDKSENKKEFKPVTLEITFESLEEMMTMRGKLWMVVIRLMLIIVSLLILINTL